MSIPVFGVSSLCVYKVEAVVLCERSDLLCSAGPVV